jgi:hypothetical protein
VSGLLALAVQLGGQLDCIVVANPSFLNVNRLVEISGRPLPHFLHILIKLYCILLLVSALEEIESRSYMYIKREYYINRFSQIVPFMNKSPVEQVS